MTDISEEQVERAARAIYMRRTGFIRNDSPLAFDKLQPDVRALLLDEARAALSAALPQWRTIDSAPKDGTAILYGFYWQGRFGWIVSGSYANGQHQHDADHPNAFPEQPTHWQPIPPPPASTEGKQATTPTSF